MGVVDSPQHDAPPGAGNGGQIARQRQYPAPGQPGEGDGLHVIRFQAPLSRGAEGETGQRRGESLHEFPVMHAAAADQQFGAGGRVPAHGPGNGLHAQPEQGGLYILGGDTIFMVVVVQMFLQPGQVEALPARAFRRRAGKIFVRQQLLQQGFAGRAGGRPGAVPVHGEIAAVPDPLVQQDIARAGIEANDIAPAAFAGEHGEVCHAADIHYGPLR